MNAAVTPVRVLLVDNRDSFTFNIAHGFAELGAAVEVLDGRVIDRHPEVADAVIASSPALVCVGPGPRGPRDLPALVAFVRHVDGKLPYFGICLGMQVLVRARGGSVVRAKAPVHGMRRAIVHESDGMFAGTPSPLFVMRYHSLICDDVGSGLRVTAWCDDEAMAVQDDTASTAAVQFHPESVGTAGGSVLLQNALTMAGAVVEHVPSPGRRGAIPSIAANDRRVPLGSLDGDHPAPPPSPATGTIVRVGIEAGRLFTLATR